MSTSTETPDFEISDPPENAYEMTDEDYPEGTTFIMHNGNRMPMSEWAAYAEENGL